MANKKNFHRRRKYAAIINAWGDKDLAYRAREWSYKRINEELAVNIPKDNTEIEIVSIDRKEKIEHYKTFVNIKTKVKNVDTQEAAKLSRKHKTTGAIARLKKQRRFQQWSLWSKNENGMPKEIENRVHRINRQLGKDYDDSAGWIITYNHYIFGGTIKGWKEKIQFNRWDSDIYTVVKAI